MSIVIYILACTGVIALILVTMAVFNGLLEDHKYNKNRAERRLDNIEHKVDYLYEKFTTKGGTKK